MKYQVSALMFGLLIGCAFAGEQNFLAEHVLGSASYRRLAGKVERPGYVVDSEDADLYEVAIGDNTPEHFLRMATLRVFKKTGEVKRLATDAAGNESWVPDETP